MQFAVKFTEQEPENLDLYAVMKDGQEVLILADVVDAGCKWATEQMAIVDDGDAEQVALLAADLRRRMPVKYSYTWRQMEYSRLDRRVMCADGLDGQEGAGGAARAGDGGQAACAETTAEECGGRLDAGAGVLGGGEIRELSGTRRVAKQKPPAYQSPRASGVCM